MNTKRRVDKRYVAPDASHGTHWERMDTAKIGRRALRPGQVVKIKGQRAASFMFLYAERHVVSGEVNLTFVGGKVGHKITRCFKPDKVGAFLYMSEVGSHRPADEETED
jgi:hypothetical protein